MQPEWRLSISTSKKFLCMLSCVYAVAHDTLYITSKDLDVPNLWVKEQLPFSHLETASVAFLIRNSQAMRICSTVLSKFFSVIFFTHSITYFRVSSKEFIFMSYDYVSFSLIFSPYCHWMNLLLMEVKYKLPLLIFFGLRIIQRMDFFENCCIFWDLIVKWDTRLEKRVKFTCATLIRKHWDKRTFCLILLVIKKQKPSIEWRSMMLTNMLFFVSILKRVQCIGFCT